MTRATIAHVAFALRVLQSPRHRAALLRLALGARLTPTRYAPSSRNGGTVGRGLSYREDRGSCTALLFHGGSAVPKSGRVGDFLTLLPTFMTTPKPPADYHTQREKLTLARIRLKAAKYEHGLLKAAVRNGKLPTADTYIRRMIAAVFNRCFR